MITAVTIMKHTGLIRSRQMKALSLIFFFTFIAGCNDRQGAKTFSTSVSGNHVSITLVYDDDKVLKQTSESKIMFSSLNVTTKEEAAKLLTPLSAKYQNISGVDQRVVYKEDWVEEHVSIDMTRVDFSKLPSLPGTMTSGESLKGVDSVSLKKTEALLEGAGFKETK